jgi:hypothetical protein
MNSTKQQQAPAKREKWYCAACGRLSSIGDKPVRKPCKCVERGEA